MLLTPSDEVVSLRKQVETLSGELAALRADYNRVEFLYRSESIINLEFQDLLNAHGIPYRDAIKRYGDKR